VSYLTPKHNIQNLCKKPWNCIYSQPSWMSLTVIKLPSSPPWVHFRQSTCYSWNNRLSKTSEHDTIYLKLDFVKVRLFVFSYGKLGIAKEFVDMVKLLFQDARCNSHVPNQKWGETRLPIGSLLFLDYGWSAKHYD